MTEELLPSPPHRLNFYQFPPPRSLARLAEVDYSEILGLRLPGPGAGYTAFVSVPFCRVRCHSCPFFRELATGGKDGNSKVLTYLDIVKEEIRFYGGLPRFKNRTCLALYFGGGTASLLPPELLGDIVNSLRANFAFDSKAEFTLEGNPRDFTSVYVSCLRELGVTRVSLGLQTFDTTLLRQTLNAPHDSVEGRTAIILCKDAGFRTVNVDLLYRLPGQSYEQLASDVQRLIELRVESITMNEYVVYPGTSAEALIRDGRLARPATDVEASDWHLRAGEQLIAAGYEESRIGGYSLPGHSQLYGALTYGNAAELIGLGAGAYGFINRYMIESSKVPSEYGSDVERRLVPPVRGLSVRAVGPVWDARLLIQSLLFTHVDRARFRDLTDRDPMECFPTQLNNMLALGLISIKDEQICLTQKGRLVKQAIGFAIWNSAIREDGSPNALSSC